MELKNCLFREDQLPQVGSKVVPTMQPSACHGEAALLACEKLTLRCSVTFSAEPKKAASP